MFPRPTHDTFLARFGAADHGIGVIEQRRPRQLAVADLDPVDAAAHRRGHDRAEVPARGRAVEDQTQHRTLCRAQNEAIPSRGLDAAA